LLPGEVCDSSATSTLAVRFDPPSLVVAPGLARPVKAIVDPDLCAPVTASFAVQDASIVTAPSEGVFDLRHPTYDLTITGVDKGSTSVTVSLARATDSAPATATLPVDVVDPAIPACSAADASSGALAGSSPTLAGAGALGQASLGVPPGAFARTDELAIAPFHASIRCAPDLASGAPGAPVALGPAVSFASLDGPSMTQSLRRELEFALPVNPAAMPAAARMRHVEVLFSSALAKAPRVVTVANPRFEKATDGSYVAKFSSPWLGTYQVVAPADGGTRKRARHLTHRAVIGFSMGGGGAATFGLRHHDQFDVIAPLGGPSDWTWLLWYVEKYALGGFCPTSNPGCATFLANRYPIAETYVHTMDYDHWWYETGSGNGGTFPRSEYIQIFEDLALMQGNPNGQNADPTLAYFAAGPKATDGFVTGDTTGLPAGTVCSIPLNPISGDPNEATQQQIQAECGASRCDPSRAWVAPHGYYDGAYNVDGSQQVISFCDGGQDGTSPYTDTWAAPTPGNTEPVNMALAVDINRNGVRDGNEPVIRQGHEPYDDTGLDGLYDSQEPGYDPVNNPDPDQDDYDFQLNPGGTENDHRWEPGEPYQDVGLDGVPHTPQQAQGGYDVGEGDGRFTMATGLVNFFSNDPHGILHGWVASVPGGPVTDDDILRLDVLADGGVRDLFNFGAVANHLVGAIASRRAADGTQLRSTAFYDNFEDLPGEDGNPDDFQATAIRWADVADSASVRYGTIDATPQQIAQGDGQHVGTALQLLFRLQTAFFFAAQRWPDADRILTHTADENPETTTVNELGTTCEIAGTCTKDFTGPSTGRTGPVVINLPQGYALEENRLRDVRYPVVFVLHGYGQSPQDLEAIQVVVQNNFMNNSLLSSATRLAKMIVVYVDGRCRENAKGEPECIRGTFYLDSNRPEGAHMDSWFEEVMAYVDQNYRTMGPSDVEVTE
jgi:hypothetical protein